MAGQYLRRGAIIDIIKSKEKTNAIQKREGLMNHPVDFTVCGCPDRNCGGWHTILIKRNLPTVEECLTLLKTNNKMRKAAKKMLKCSRGTN
jgi:hypothetical protein